MGSGRYTVGRTPCPYPCAGGGGGAEWGTHENSWRRLLVHGVGSSAGSWDRVASDGGSWVLPASQLLQRSVLLTPLQPHLGGGGSLFCPLLCPSAPLSIHPDRFSSWTTRACAFCPLAARCQTSWPRALLVSGHPHPMPPRWALSLGSPKIVPSSQVCSPLPQKPFPVLSVAASGRQTPPQCRAPQLRFLRGQPP